MNEELDAYAARGARALVLLHEIHLRQCLSVWKQAKAADLKLPPADAEPYRSLDHLLQHILGAAKQYMVTMCQLLDLPDPEVDPVPELAVVAAKADIYTEHLLERWRLPLATVPDERLEPPPELYIPGMPYWIDAMLEHAVMHPIRHEFQLKELLRQQAEA